MVDNELKEWLLNMNDGVRNFLEIMSEREYSYFRYSLSGDLKDRSFSWGLANIVFAIKILYITGLIDEIEERKKNNLYKSIRAFITPQGYICDPFITSRGLKEKVIDIFIPKLKFNRLEYAEATRRAETRQSFAALALLGKKPNRPFVHIPYSLNGINRYLANFDWSIPWHAGSNFSHLLFFLYMNKEFFSHRADEVDGLIKYATEWIRKIQSKDDGCWYMGKNVSLQQKINGAMKIATGLHAAQIYEIPYAEKLIDTCLSAVNDYEACSNFNIIYVLYSCLKVNPEYRREEIIKFAVDRLKIYMHYYHKEGGFSFYRNRANDILNGKKISLGKNEPDIHGTIMFIWGISIINEILDIGLDYKIPIN